MLVVAAAGGVAAGTVVIAFEFGTWAFVTLLVVSIAWAIYEIRWIERQKRDLLRRQERLQRAARERHE